MSLALTKPASPLRVAGVLYFLLLALIAGQAWNTLSLRQKDAAASLRSGTLIYVAQDSWQSELAQVVSQAYSIRAVEAGSISSAADLPESIRGKTVVAPTLVFGTPGEARIASGTMAVQKAFEQADIAKSPFSDGRKAVFIILLLALATPPLFSESSRFLALYPLVGLFGLSLLYAPCVSCAGSTEGWAMAGLILLALVYFAFSFTVLRGGSAQKRWTLAVVAAGGGAVPLVQGLLLAASPKLCAGCLSVTAGAMLSGWAALAILRNQVPTRLRMPRTVVVVSALMFAGLFSRAIANSMGYAQPKTEGEHTAASLLGQPASKYIRGSVPRNGLVFVGSIACSACRKAESDLAGKSIDYRKIQPCSFIRDTDCFDYQGVDVPIPMFLGIDGDGNISYQHNGWSDSAKDVSSLISQLRGQTSAPRPTSDPTTNP